MARRLAVLPELHYIFEGSEVGEAAKRHMRGVFGDGLPDAFALMFANCSCMAYWENLEISTDLKKRSFDALYVDSVCSPLQARSFKRKYMKKDYEAASDNVRDNYLKKWISAGTKVRHTENIVWWFLYNLASISGNKEAKDWTMDWRDYCMARNIDNTLKDGEEAVLIVGAAHNPEKHLRKLAPDVKIDERFRKVFQMCYKNKNERKK